MITENPDKFGFYSVGDLKTYSKVEAIELSKSTGKESIWHFNDEIFSSLDWKQDPNLSLLDLYKVRARQIRDAYDHIVLFYSGGSDSHNILKCWLQADCKIDEIASFYNYDATKDKQSYLNAEITNVVIPHIELLKQHGFDFKFRLIDISQLSLDVINEFDADYLYLINRNFSPNNPAKTIIRNKIRDYQDIIASGKRLCFVWGIEKPVVSHDGARYYASFNDSVDNVVNPFVQNNFYNGWYDELFYWTPDLPLLPIKMAHELKNFMNNNLDTQFYQDSFAPHAYNAVLKKYLTFDATKTILYPFWDPDTFCNGKTRSMIFSKRDLWLWDGNILEIDKYRSNISNMVKSLGVEWVDSKNIRIHSSPRYYLE